MEKAYCKLICAAQITKPKVCYFCIFTVKTNKRFTSHEISIS